MPFARTTSCHGDFIAAMGLVTRAKSTLRDHLVADGMPGAAFGLIAWARPKMMANCQHTNRSGWLAQIALIVRPRRS
jgi:hypothetical protein